MILHSTSPCHYANLQIIQCCSAVFVIWTLYFTSQGFYHCFLLVEDVLLR